MRLILPMMGFGTWRRRPDPVFAMKIASEDDVYGLPESVPVTVERDGFKVETHHGAVRSEWGDYLATDGKGDWWPVDAAIFEERYEVMPSG